MMGTPTMRIRRLKALKLFAFVIVATGTVLLAEAGQAIGETFLVPQENRMHELVNQARASQGLGPLSRNDALRWIARRQASAMASHGYIFHNPDLVADAEEASLPWYALGENVGKGPTVDDIQRAFLASPSHRSNIVKSNFNNLGVGGIADPEAVLYFTQMFAGLETVQAPPPAPAATTPPPTTPSPLPPTAALPPTEPPPPPPTATPDAAETPVTAVTEDGPDEQNESIEPEGEGERPERPSIWQVLLAMLRTFFSKLAFWS